jgi:Tfp pilus assembly protein PilO
MREKRVNTAEYIKLIKESPEKRRSYMFLGFTIFVSIVLIIFAIRPTVLTITRINSEIKEKKRINSQLEEKINTLSALDTEYNENREAFDSLELIFPISGTFSLFTSNIEAIVARNGFSLTSVNFDKYKGKEYSSTTRILVPNTIRISVVGRRVNIVNLLQDLESLPLYPVIDSVSYSQKEDEEGLGSFSIGLRVFTVENVNFYK